MDRILLKIFIAEYQALVWSVQFTGSWGGQVQELGNQWILTKSFRESIRLNICTVLILKHTAGCSYYWMTVVDLACLTLISKQGKLIFFVLTCSVSPEVQVGNWAMT